MKPVKFLVFILTLSMSLGVLAQVNSVQEPMVFETQEQEERFKELTLELRCTVCQNQNLADSDATLAHDLRRQVHEMLLAGKTNEEIKNFMVERYGDFVLYRPPVQTNTYLLWVAPLLMLLAGALILRVNIKKRSSLLNTNETNDHQDTSL
jgi:cytochrome c-type biogenesis protein CcmH